MADPQGAAFRNISAKKVGRLSTTGEGLGYGTVGATGIFDAPTSTAISDRYQLRNEVQKQQWKEDFERAALPKIVDPSGMIGLQRYFQRDIIEEEKPALAKLLLSSAAAGGLAFYLTSSPSMAVGSAIVGYLIGKKVL